MNNVEYANVVLNELSQTLTKVNIESAENFIDHIIKSEEIFCAGTGRRICYAPDAYGHKVICCWRNMYP